MPLVYLSHPPLGVTGLLQHRRVRHHRRGPTPSWGRSEQADKVRLTDLWPPEMLCLELLPKSIWLSFVGEHTEELMCWTAEARTCRNNSQVPGMTSIVSRLWELEHPQWHELSPLLGAVLQLIYTMAQIFNGGLHKSALLSL